MHRKETPPATLLPPHRPLAHYVHYLSIRLLQSPPTLDGERAYAIRINYWKWINGTNLHFFFIPGADDSDDQRSIVRWAFGHWQQQDFGLTFTEVGTPHEAEIRIKFDFKRGLSNSYIGTDNLRYVPPNQTMNFGWDLRTEWGRATALHEIGHAIGLSHEHQNPNAGIKWDEPAVIKEYEASQRWSEIIIRSNIINKIISDVTDTAWDVTSIMHYPFKPHLIITPHPYDETGTPENTQLSAVDISFVRSIYPAKATPYRELRPMSLVNLDLLPGQQADFDIKPKENRKYRISTVGVSDSRMVLFEYRDGQPWYVTADDDSGAERNAQIEIRLVSGRCYHLGVRLHYSYGFEGFGVMMV